MDEITKYTTDGYFAAGVLPIGGCGRSGNSWITISPPAVSLTKQFRDQHGLERVEDKKWKVVHLTFEDLIDLQIAGVKYTWMKADKEVFMCFESDADESQAIMIVGNAPYDEE